MRKEAGCKKVPGMMTESGGEWRLTDKPERLAASFTLQAIKNR
jgi:hypothetical protein